MPLKAAQKSGHRRRSDSVVRQGVVVEKMTQIINSRFFFRWWSA
jgi:hypothetical protein